MRVSLVLAASASLALTAGAAQAADAKLACRGEVQATSLPAAAPMEVQVTVAGGLDAPEQVTYAWTRPEGSVPLSLKGLLGDNLQFHGVGTDKNGGVVVADAQLNRATLALVLKVRRVSDAGAEDVTLESSCRRV